MLALLLAPSAYIPIWEESLTSIIPAISLTILAVLVYIPTAPVFPDVRSIVPAFVPVLAEVPFTKIPIPSVPTFKPPEEVIFIFSAYTAVPFTKSDAFIFIFMLLVSVPLPL